MEELNEGAFELDQESIEDAKNSDVNVDIYEEEEEEEVAEEEEAEDEETAGEVVEEECDCVTTQEVCEDKPTKRNFITKLKEDYPWLYRALRTFLQTFISVACTDIAAHGIDELTKKTVFAIIAASGAAAIAAVMNIQPKEQEG